MQDYPTLRGSSGKSNSNKGTAGAITMLHNWLLVVTVSDGEVSKVFLVHHTAAAYKSSDRNTAGCSVTHVWSTAGICYELSCGGQNRSSPHSTYISCSSYGKVNNKHQTITLSWHKQVNNRAYEIFLRGWKVKANLSLLTCFGVFPL